MPDNGERERWTALIQAREVLGPAAPTELLVVAYWIRNGSLPDKLLPVWELEVRSRLAGGAS